MGTGWGGFLAMDGFRTLICGAFGICGRGLILHEEARHKARALRFSALARLAVPACLRFAVASIPFSAGYWLFGQKHSRSGHQLV